MASATTSTADPLRDLSSLVENAVLLIQGFEVSLKDVVDSNNDAGTAADKWTTTSTAEDREKQLDCLAIARDSASLVKAHSTKISLFIITEPFTPSAIVTVLKQLIQGPVPAIASAVQQCHADLYTRHFRRDLAWKCSRVLKELRELIQKIPKDGKVLPQDQRSGISGAKSQKGSITATGVLWGVCDEVVAFANLGVVGHLVDRAEQFRDTLKDVMEELKEWSEEQDEENEDEDEDENEARGDDAADEHGIGNLAEDMNNNHISTQAILDDFMSQATIPRDDPEKIRERLNSTLRRLRLTVLLYQALIKRRLKTLPKLPLASQADTVIVSRLDEVMPLLRKITDLFNSLAVAFYELDSAEINSLMDQCFFDAYAASELLSRPWNGQKDEFTDWAAKFQAEIKKN